MKFCFFFFQAEDGIRDADVTGVQTCALPISVWAEGPELNDLGTLWLKNIGFLTSWGYTDTTSLSQTTGQPNVPVSFQGSTASLFKLTIDKPIVDHILRYAGKGHPGTPEWDLVVKPWHIVGN